MTVDNKSSRRDFLKFGGSAVAAVGTSTLSSPSGAENTTGTDAPALQLNIDGKGIAIADPKKYSFEMNKELLKPENFNEFTQDPDKFSRKYGIVVDKEFSNLLKDRLQGVKSLDDAQKLLRGCPSCATVWAVAEGSYSVASSKIAVAY